jgi:hypothetical protein
MCSKNRKKSKRVVSRRRRKTEFNQRSSRGKPTRLSSATVDMVHDKRAVSRVALEGLRHIGWRE